MNGTEVEILLVEDNVHDAELTVRALTKVNLANKIVHVKDGEAALDFVFAKGQFEGRQINDKPKVIMLDIKMPKIDGIEVLRQLKSHNLTKAIPVVIMTSSREEQDVVTSYNLGVNSYVVKPVNFEAFAKAISDLGLYWLVINQPPL